ncbi:NAD-dependent epimerase/dehydratase family protein [uncultured Campylobacter sp.]|uniref:NAD-dependent epimerase/dehydratase family protein n=1 Tax=uncultured Campylobacter sp. TaxID=218934 RepID=UPI002623C7B1|nr:NAD-dependent epimerase/dehydratase family protein [uncultured Campylobacter sp.]
MKILLTGATGFVGTNFVLNLHKKYEIIALVRQSSDVSKIDKFCKIYRYDESIESRLMA